MTKKKDKFSYQIMSILSARLFDDGANNKAVSSRCPQRRSFMGHGFVLAV